MREHIFADAVKICGGGCYSCRCLRWSQRQVQGAIATGKGHGKIFTNFFDVRQENCGVAANSISVKCGSEHFLRLGRLDVCGV